MAAALGEVPHLDEPFTVSGTNAAGVPTQIVTSNVVSQRSHAEALIQFTIALMQTYQTIPW